jgi:hypothetical protein
VLMKVISIFITRGITAGQCHINLFIQFNEKGSRTSLQILLEMCGKNSDTGAIKIQ